MRFALVIWLFIFSAHPALGASDPQIVRGISIWQVRLDHLTQQEAKEVLQKKIIERVPQQLTFQIDQQSFDLKTEWIQADLEPALNRAVNFGRSGIWWKDWWDRLRLYVHPVNLESALTLDETEFLSVLRPQLASFTVTQKNAELVITPQSGTSTLSIRIEPERDGMMVDADTVLRMMKERLANLNFSPLIIPSIQVKAERRASDLEALIDQVPSWLAHAPFKLTADGEPWNVSKDMLASWLDGVSQENGMALGLSPERVETRLTAWLGNTLQEAQDGSLTVENTSSTRKATTLVAPKDGVALNMAATIQNMQDGFAAGSSSISIVLERKPAAIEGADAERLGIRELIGKGSSNFSGSPVNRRKNIALGSAKVHGTLIAPEQEFSLVKTLGPIDQKNGWFKELVIKQNKTIPEYGGGLCQIGTTSFRAAIGSGLPVTARVNHAYRVPYYEPAGKDATIYEPAPDFKFKNDTGHWILITTQIKGNDITFFFWGTRDGRIIEESQSRIYNFVSPPEKKMIETLDLPPGETKCTEKAHTGADASFTYDVTYPNGEKKHVTFFSRYKPWGAVCLVGVAQLSASSTAAAANVDETGVNNPN